MALFSFNVVCSLLLKIVPCFGGGGANLIAIFALLPSNHPDNEYVLISTLNTKVNTLTTKTFNNLFSQSLRYFMYIFLYDVYF